MKIIPFQFKTSSIRVIDKDGEPWFIAKDIAELLGYSRPFDAIATHCKAASRLKFGETPSLKIPPRGLTIIPERDVYRLIIRSKLPEAQRFEEWVVGEVLPCIRKTGNYGLTKINWSDAGHVAGLLAQSLERVQELNKQIESLQPKADFHDHIVASPEATSVEKAAKLIGGIGRNKLMAFLRLKGWVTKNNIPYQSKINQGLMDVKMNPWTDHYGYFHENITPLVTPKGIDKLRILLKEKSGLLNECHH
ncbi:phage antirepressor KilAC domain-containing protein [Zooshikella ganghwensis]|uniref:phage antirepressor KilAC domain-containing protein n=1 Tax=Zooshikella ganghwensis TaxID=202772 RepID=UPI000406F2A4|nr:phage antirepressor KilAC domain-containing protein [Zooshikella ganghwensis]